MAIEISPAKSGGPSGKRRTSYGNKDAAAFSVGEKPHDVDTEKALLAGVLLSNDSLLEVQEIVTKNDFFLPAHQIIFDSCVQLTLKNIPIDLTTLVNHLREHAKLELVGGAAYLSQLASVPSTSIHAREYAQIITDLAWRRRLIEAGEQCRALALKAGETQTIAAEIEKNVFEATQAKKVSSLSRIGDLLPEAIKELERRTDSGGQSEDVVNSGLKDLDSTLSGFRPGQLIILAARPGMGKTSLATNIVHHIATKQNKAVLFFSLEMTKEELVERVISFSSGIDAGKLKTGKLGPEDYQELFFAAEECEDAPIYVDDRSVVSPFDVLAQARKLKSSLGLVKNDNAPDLGLIIVDYIQIMKSGGFYENRSLEVAAITGGLKAIAKELRVPVIALSQLNREVARRGNETKRPQLSDLKDSGAIEADADVVMFIHREQSEETDSRAPSEAEIVVAKQRSGPTRNVKVTWLGHLTRFTDHISSEPNYDNFNPQMNGPSNEGGF